MQKKIQFQKDADVISENGDQIGLLERVVLNLQTKVVTDLIVRTGSIFDRQEKVVPIHLVVRAGDHLVVLRDDKELLKTLAPFEEKRMVADIGLPNHQHQFEGVHPVIYEYHGTAPTVVPNRSDDILTITERNIPEGTVALKEGARVIGFEGKQVGKVESIFADPVKEQITHLTISSGGHAKEIKIIPIQWVEMVGEDELHLKVKKDSLEELEDIAALD